MGLAFAIAPKFSQAAHLQYVPSRQPTNDPETLIRDADLTDPLSRDVANFMLAQARQLLMLAYKRPDSTLSSRMIEVGPRKTLARMDAKAREIQGGYDKLGDISRLRHNANTSDEIAALCAVYNSAYKNESELPHGAKIIRRPANRFMICTATGYAAFYAHVALPLDNDSGYHIAEHMVVSRPFEHFIAAGNPNSHTLYERARAIELRYKEEALPPDIAKKHGQLMGQLRTLHDRGRANFGLDRIPFTHFDNLLESLDNPQPISVAAPALGALPAFA